MISLVIARDESKQVESLAMLFDGSEVPHCFAMGQPSDRHERSGFAQRKCTVDAASMLGIDISR